MRKSIFKKVSAVVCAMALTVTMASTCFAADRWESYFGQNKNWYEGALGELRSQSETGWVASLDQIGWGGVWGAQVKDEKVSLSKGVEYEISFDLTSDQIDKWVFIKVADKKDKLIFGDWIQLKAGKKTSYTKKFTLDAAATKVVFGLGGEFGDRTDQKDMYALSSTLPHDGDATYATIITCENFKLGEAGGTEKATEKAKENNNNNNTNNNSTTNTNTTTTTTTTVKTGDFTPVACAAMAVAAAAVIVVFTRKREDA